MTRNPCETTAPLRAGRERPALRVGLAGALALGGAVAACGDDLLTPPVCTADFRYGLNVRVLDGLGRPAAEGALGLAVDGEVVDTLMVLTPDLMVGAGERPGTWDLNISKSGYASWSAENITVTSDVCHVIPVSLEAVLIPTP